MVYEWVENHLVIELLCTYCGGRSHISRGTSREVVPQIPLALVKYIKAGTNKLL